MRTWSCGSAVIYVIEYLHKERAPNESPSVGSRISYWIIKAIKRRNTMKRLAVVSAAFFIFASCLLPDEFNMNIAIHDDLSFTFHYSGKLKDIFYMNAAQNGETISASDKASYDDLDKQLLSDPGFSKISSLGNGQYVVEFSHNGSIAEKKYVFMNESWAIMTFSYDESGALHIEQTSLDLSQNDQFKSLKYTPKGQISLTFDAKHVKIDTTSKGLRLAGNLGTFKFDQNTINGFSLKASATP
jgi:hypothetical protein